MDSSDFFGIFVQLKTSFAWIHHGGPGLIDLNTMQEMIVSIYKAILLFTKDAFHLVTKLIGF